MKTLILEIRDKATFIPVIATMISREDGPLACQAGYGDPMIILTKISGGLSIESHYDTFRWSSSSCRTMRVAHEHILHHWDELKDNDVIDVEYILKETTQKKCSNHLYPQLYEAE